MAEEKPPGRPKDGAAPAAPLRPTVMKPPAPRSRERKAAPAVAPPVPTGPSPGGGAPTAMAGVRRERLDVDAAELHVLAPDTPAPVAQAAAQMLREVVVAKMSERKAVLWGNEAQKSYGAHVTGTFSLAQDPVVEQARAYVNRMTAILGAIDLMAVCGHGRGSLFGSLAKAMSKSVDTPRELSSALDELRVLLERTGNAIDRLLQLKERLQKHADAISKLENEIEASALAALYLSGHYATKSPALAQLFTDRSMSLTATLAQMRQGNPIHKMQVEQPLQLISAIQNVALVSLPGAIAGMSALLTLLSTRGASPTEARDMSYQLRDLLSQLNT